MTDPRPDPFAVGPDGLPRSDGRRRPLCRRRVLWRDIRRAHAEASTTLAAIDTELEAVLARRQACLDELGTYRERLRVRFSADHVRRSGGVDEPPVPPAPVDARPLWGVDLRATALAILRRHGPQRLRDLHGLLHCYGYVVDGVRPVQRLADALAYERSRGRAERVERGVYAAADGRDGDGGLPPAPDLGAPLPWSRPITDAGPPLIDPPVAHDPELWGGRQWPLPGVDPVPEPTPDPEPDPAAAGAERVDPPTHLAGSATPPAPLGDDSSTNRLPGPSRDVPVSSQDDPAASQDTSAPRSASRTPGEEVDTGGPPLEEPAGSDEPP